MATALPAIGIRRRSVRLSATDMLISRHPSPNFGGRRGGVIADLIVLHYTAMASPAAALDRLCDPACEVSAHYFITPQGDVLRLVEEDQRAWHAGAGAWGGCRDINSRSIGIELANDGFSPFSAAQMNALEALLGPVMTRWSIPPERVIAHSDMAPGRKSDPGVRFDWFRLARSGLSIWPEPVDGLQPDPDRFRVLARAFGYNADVTTAQLLAAVRLRFRPWAKGALDSADMGLIADLARRFPVDQPPANA